LLKSVLLCYYFLFSRSDIFLTGFAGALFGSEEVSYRPQPLQNSRLVYLKTSRKRRQLSDSQLRKLVKGCESSLFA
jgi:hypothetical protein